MKSTLLALLALYLVYAAVMVVLHPKLIYPFFNDDSVLSGFERVTFTAADGTQIFMQEARGKGPVLLYFMGNAGALLAFDPPLQEHARAGRHVIAMEYRGGAGRPGTPSEDTLKSDALLVAEYAISKGKPVVVQGYSLGSGLAVHVASTFDVAQVILEAPYSRLCTLMAQRSFLPACVLPGVQTWNTLADAPRVKAPVLILHGAADTLIPPQQSVLLQETLPNAERIVLNGAGHLDLSGHPDARLATQQVFDRLKR